MEDAQGVNLSGPVFVPDTGGPQRWATVNANVTLPAGPQTLTLVQDAPGFALNWFRFGSPVPPGPLPDGKYKLLGHDGLALDVGGQKTDNGSGLDLYQYISQANQIWTLHHLGGGVYEIIGVQSGRSLTASGGSVVISDYLALPGQQWTLLKIGDACKIKSVANGRLFGTDPAGALGLADATGQPGQLWKIAPAP